MAEPEYLVDDDGEIIREFTPEELEESDREEEARLQRLAVRASTAGRPRLFTICDDFPESNDEIVIAWGMAFDNKTVVYRRSSPAESGYARVTDSPEKALNFLSRVMCGDVRLIWLDSEPTANGTGS